VKTEQTSLHASAPNRTALREGVTPEDHDDVIAFLDSCQARGLSRKSLVTYREASLLLAEFTASKGMPLLQDLQREHIETFFGHLRAKGNKPATIKNRHSSLRALFTWMQHEDIRTDHPMDRIRMARVPEQVLPHYTDDEMARLLRAIPNKGTDLMGLRDRALLLFFLDTGSRCQEVCDVSLCDVDREARHVEIVAGKGGEGRMVGYSAETANAINRMMRRRGGWDAQGATAPLFPTKSGGRLTTNGVRMLMQRRFAGADVEFRGTHAFRRTFGIGFLESGGDPTDLKTLAGWSSWSMLARYTKATATSRALRAHEEHSPVARMMQKGRKS
jgi:site-specific recombinase XerD